MVAGWAVLFGKTVMQQDSILVTLKHTILAALTIVATTIIIIRLRKL